MIRWAEPFWLLALLAPAALLLLEFALRFRDRAARRRFAADPLWRHLAPGRSAALRRTRRWLLLAGMAFIALALADPRIGTRWEEVKREGIDIFLCVDVSRSMDTGDIRPSRIMKARFELRRFLQGLKGDRVGIVPFAGTAYPLMPLTLDYDAAAMFLDLLDTRLIPTPGTAIAEAIETALASFPEEEARGRAILLISDGEDHEGGAVEAAKKAREMGVPVYTIGMALAKGDPIPLLDENGVPSGWKRDDEGHIVTSRLNEDLLRGIADVSGGKYWRATQGGGEFRSAYRALLGLDRKEIETRRITDYEDRFQPLLVAAVLLLTAGFILPEGRRTPRPVGHGGKKTQTLRGKRRGTAARSKRAAVPAGAAIALLLLFGASPAAAQKGHKLVKEGNRLTVEKKYDDALSRYLEAKALGDSTRPELLYDLGGIYARKGDIARADSLYRSLPPETRRDLLARAAYNRGTAFAQQKEYSKALDSFIESLKLNPGDADAKANLELARRMLRQQQQQQQEGDKNQQQKQQQDNQQQQQGGEKKQQQDNQQQDNQQQQPGEEDQQQEQGPRQQEGEKMDRELAERFLNQLKQDEKELLKKVVRQQIPAKKKKVKKDW